MGKWMEIEIYKLNMKRQSMWLSHLNDIQMCINLQSNGTSNI